MPLFSFRRRSKCTRKPCIPSPDEPIFPSKFRLYRSSCPTTTFLSLSLKDKNPFAQSSTYKSLPSQADIVLYEGRNKPCAKIASARVAENGEMRIGFGLQGIERLVNEGGFCASYLGYGERERFQWARLSCSELMLVRIGTGEIVVVYKKASWHRKKMVGDVSFLGGEKLGDGLRIMAVMSLLVILKEEKKMTHHRCMLWGRRSVDNDGHHGLTAPAC